MTRCGEFKDGHHCEIGCGKFLPRNNWMRRDGLDGRGGDRGNAPLCHECSEDV